MNIVFFMQAMVIKGFSIFDSFYRAKSHCETITLYCDEEAHILQQCALLFDGHFFFL